MNIYILKNTSYEYNIHQGESLFADSLCGQPAEMKGLNPSTGAKSHQPSLKKWFLGGSHDAPSSSKRHFVGSGSQSFQTSLEFRNQRHTTVQSSSPGNQANETTKVAKQIGVAYYR